VSIGPAKDKKGKWRSAPEKLPTTLEELTELAKKPPKHKRMRKWEFP
jgi:hypothetical protein